jgi:hypothetical protein
MTDEFINYFRFNCTFTKPYREKEYKLKISGQNKYATPNDVFSAYATFKAKTGQTADVTLAEVADYITKTTPKDEQEERKPCRQWIMEWLEAHKDNWKFNIGWTAITYMYNGIPRNKTLVDLKDALMEDVYQYQLAYKTEEVKTTLDCIARDMSSNAVSTIFHKIAYDATMVDPCDRFLHGIYDYLKPEESYEIFKTLMMHWGWMCKRRMLGREVIWHIWPNFYGATGLGKTTLLKKLCSPMADYTSVTNISMLFDSTREIAKLSEYYVLIFDELAVNVEGEPGGNLTEDNKSTLKSMITADYLDVRVYGTQKQSKQKITFVPISAANHHLYDIIFDDTSMRRFFEFHCSASKPKDYSEINKYLDHSDVFWRGIDEDLDRGYWDPNGTEIGEEISKIQASYYPTRTTTSMWIQACHVIPGKMSGTSAYKAYCGWCRETGNKQKTMQNFIKDIAHMLPEAIDEAGKAHLVWQDEDDQPIYRQSSTCLPDQFDQLVGMQDDEDAA